MSERDERQGDEQRDGLTRKQLLGTGASAAAAALLAQGTGVERALGAGKGGRRDVSGMNVVLILTDQERAIQHFPPNWLRQNLPGMRRLRQHGVSFERAFTNACMCSPARSTLMSGYFPAQHGVKYTLEEDMPFPEYPHQVELPRPPELPNLATVMRAAGYNVVYKGKWHCSKPAQKENAQPSDLERYGWTRWNPPDAGANQSVPEAGGGFVDNDGRFMESVGSPEAGSEGVMQYLGSAAAKQQPFFLVISLVNPHDVLFYPSKTFEEAGYDDSWIQGDIEVPETNGEDLSTKPSVQEQFLRIFNLTGKPKTKAEKRAYLNYYGNLMRSSDNYIVNVLDKLEETGLYDDTLIVRTADHGEMGLSHGGLRQKTFNAYEETINIPLVVSNPVLFPRPAETPALASLVDLLPTMLELSGRADGAELRGRPLTPLLAAAADPGREALGRAPVDLARALAPTPAASVQDEIHFTYDDHQAGTALQDVPGQPNRIRCIRTGRMKYAFYFDPAGRAQTEHEMYDLERDPDERVNLVDRFSGEAIDPVRRGARRDLGELLDHVMEDCGTDPRPAERPPVG